MQFQEYRQERLLRLAVRDRSLVERAEWDAVLALSGPPVALVALDLGEVEFISSLFLESCIQLRRLLAERGQALVLVNLSPDHQQLLDAVGGPGRLPVARDEAELAVRLSSLTAPESPGERREGVTPAEKSALWG